jgi:nitrogen fixation protein NifZ
MVNVETLEEGDVVHAKVDFHNDGSLEALPEDELLAAEGARGVIVRKGHLEEDPGRTVFLVRFEDAGKKLGIPIGCWAEELRAEEA